MEKLYTSKTFLKVAGGRVHTPSSYLPSHRLSYRNHQKSLAYFSHLAPLILYFFTERQSQRGGGYGTTAPPLNTLLQTE